MVPVDFIIVGQLLNPNILLDSAFSLIVFSNLQFMNKQNVSRVTHFKYQGIIFLYQITTTSQQTLFQCIYI